MLAVADLLGVPEADHERFREGFGFSTAAGHARGRRRAGAQRAGLARRVVRRLRRGPPPRAARRRPHRPRLATYPDGSTPDVLSVVRIATFLFAAGQETTARLLATALKYLAEDPELQDQLREQRDLIPNFIEEALRIESPVKADFRLARRRRPWGTCESSPARR